MAVALLAGLVRDLEGQEVSAEDFKCGRIHHFVNVIVPPVKLSCVVVLVCALPIIAGPRVFELDGITCSSEHLVKEAD